MKTAPLLEPPHCLMGLPNESDITRRPPHHDDIPSPSCVQGIAPIRDAELVESIREFLQPQRPRKMMMDWTSLAALK
jgi:hypothetical protein